MSNMSNPELIFYNGHRLNEAMFYDERSKTLYFCAIRYNTIYALSLESGRVRTYETNGAVGGAVVDSDGFIVEAEKSGIFRINPQNGEKTFVAQILPQPTMRYNHLILDSRGRILVDVMGDELRHAGEGGLYLIDGERVECLISGTTTANGVALNPDETKLYFTDTPTRTVWEYAYDIDSGRVSEGRIAVKFADDYVGLPDGVMLLGDELVIAEWASGTLSRYSLSGELLEELKLPSTHVTSSCLVGDSIYVATAKASADEPAPSGGIFRVKI